MESNGQACREWLALKISLAGEGQSWDWSHVLASRGSRAGLMPHSEFSASKLLHTHDSGSPERIKQDSTSLIKMFASVVGQEGREWIMAVKENNPTDKSKTDKNRVCYQAG